MMNQYRIPRIILTVTGLAIISGTVPPSSRLAAQRSPGVSVSVVSQMNALIAEKASRTPAQRKMDSQLVYAVKMSRGERIAVNVSTLDVRLSDADERGVVVDVRANVSDRLIGEIRALGADVLDVSARYGHLRVRSDLGQIEAIAELPDVSFVQPKQELLTNRTRSSGGPRIAAPPQRIGGLGAVRRAVDPGEMVTWVGSRNSEGDTTHRAALARATYGVSGAGVKVGVLSDGVTNLAASQAAGDLGSVTVLSAGSGDEGTAMLEIIHDLAPDADLYFATALGGVAAFAQNIRNLQAAGCTIIVDDARYTIESPFQDGQIGTSPTNGAIVAQAVKDVAAAGVLYFSSLGNSGNKNDNTSGTWEGDFVDGGAATGPLLGNGQIHNFGVQLYNQFLDTSETPVTLFWSDPLGASANDYDLYILDSTGTSIVASSNNFQTGTQDPFEAIEDSFAGERVVIAKFSGSARFLHLATTDNLLEISTAGSTRGHAATTAPNSFAVAATPALNPGPYPAAFSSGNVVERFSSDGPRRIFFGGDGAPLTPGNVSSTGGQVLQKPDFTAADRVSVTGVGGFPTTFFGTSAAASHAAAIAALAKSRNLAATPAVIRTALLNSAIDIETPGVDRDSGYGIIMADTSVAGVPLLSTSAGDFDGDGKSDVTVYRPSNGVWYSLRSSTNNATHVDYQWGVSTDKPVPGDYDGDGTTDIAIYRPSTGEWYVLLSTTSFASFVSYQWGVSTDTPVPADYDGDGKTDVAIYRPATGVWHVLRSSANNVPISYQWGVSGDIPVPGDYDGDSKADISIYRPATGAWYVLRSTTNSTTFISYQWGVSTDIPVAADYDGDVRTDIAVYRPATGSWYVLLSSTNSTTFISYQWGMSTDVPVPADYDGDSKTDVAVYRPATGSWYVLLSSTNSTTFVSYQWGTSTDIPVLKRP